jgi:hypothetical protein
MPLMGGILGSGAADGADMADDGADMADDGADMADEAGMAYAEWSEPLSALVPAPVLMAALMPVPVPCPDG